MGRQGRKAGAALHVTQGKPQPSASERRLRALGGPASIGLAAFSRPCRLCLFGSLPLASVHKLSRKRRLDDIGRAK